MDEKFGRLTDLMNAHFIVVAENQERMIRKQDITNGRVNSLELKQALRDSKQKYLRWKMAGMVLLASILAVLIQSFGVLEFLKLIK